MFCNIDYIIQYLNLEVKSNVYDGEVKLYYANTIRYSINCPNGSGVYVSLLTRLVKGIKGKHGPKS